ncbi:MAG: carbohydrate ABC transporter permease [Sphaerochaetaceae bacterium]|jgi:ABC-type glycerol-3-phosphate transport system permease component|nr:carbohydrate ABC transporter permease [Sphaerochaetaceae bacterium]
MKPKMLLIGKILTYLIIVIWILFTIIPLYWLLSSTFKPTAEAIGYPPTLFPKHPTLENFKILFTATRFNFGSYGNSMIIGLGAMFISLSAALFAGYGLSRIKFRGKHIVMTGILLFQMVPVLATLIPLYQTFSKYGLYNTHFGLMLIYATQTAPMNTWLLKGYFDTIPYAIEEAAQIDGLSRIQSLIRIALPIAAPGLSASAIFAFFRAWNEYMIAMTMTSTVRPYTVELYRFIGEQGDVDWSLLGTAAFIAVLPVFVLFSFFQKYFIIGMSGGAIKS